MPRTLTTASCAAEIGRAACAARSIPPAIAEAHARRVADELAHAGAEQLEELEREVSGLQRERAALCEQLGLPLGGDLGAAVAHLAAENQALRFQRQDLWKALAYTRTRLERPLSRESQENLLQVLQQTGGGR